jgi:cell division septum initiation protein DivIVA
LSSSNQENYHEFSEETSMRKIVEENEDLKRQIIFLQQQVQEKEHRTRVLEKLLVADTKIFDSSGKCRKSVNSATQVCVHLSDII